MKPNEELSHRDLSYKLTALLMVLTGSRVNCIQGFRTDSMTKTHDSYTFYPTKLLKHSRPTFIREHITYRAFPHNKQLCIYETITHYIERKKKLVDTAVLIITHRKPYRPAHKDTLARWLKETLRLAGMDA